MLEKNDDIFTLEEAMNLLKCNRYQIMKYKEKYYLPLYKYNNHYVIEKKKLSLWNNTKDEIEKKKLKEREQTTKGVLTSSIILLYLVVLIISFVTSIIMTMFCLLFLVGIAFIYAYKQKQIEIIKENILTLISEYDEMTIEKFKEYRKNNKNDDFEGIYIFYNLSKDKYYIGQSTHVIERISDHLKGKGCRSLYIDYKCGDNITIKMINIDNTEYERLNKLERETILTLDGFETGYNKNRGIKY